MNPAAVAALARITEATRSQEPIVGVLVADLRAVLGLLYDVDEERRILLMLLVRR